MLMHNPVLYYCHTIVFFMQPGGKDIQVTSQNIREYLQVWFRTT